MHMHWVRAHGTRTCLVRDLRGEGVLGPAHTQLPARSGVLGDRARALGHTQAGVGQPVDTHLGVAMRESSRQQVQISTCDMCHAPE